MKTVLLVDHAPIFGGSESFLLDLASALDRRAFSPVIVSDEASPVLPMLRAGGDTVLTMPFPRLNRSAGFAWRLIQSGARLAGLAKECRADLIHTFTARTHLVGAVASKLSGIPLLWRIGDDTLHPAIMSAFGRVPRSIVGVSQWLTAQYPRLRFDGLVPDGARAPMRISREEARHELGVPRDALLVVHVGRLVRWKGQDVFIKALADAARHVPALQGIVVGTWGADDTSAGPLGGGEAYYRHLTRLAEDLGLNSAGQQRLMFSGFLRDPGLAYAAADVFVHSSTLPEPFGRTIIEAMMSGCPVIAARAGGPAEIIVHGESGLLTTPGDAGALTSALLELLQSATRRLELAEGGRRRAEAEYTLPIMTRRMEAAYSAALAIDDAGHRAASAPLRIHETRQ